jgi:hypothetical protein
VKHRQINPALAAALLDGARRGRIEAKARRAGTTDPAAAEREQLRAAVQRVRAECDRLDHFAEITASAPDRSLYRALAEALRAALDGPVEPAEQPQDGPCCVCGTTHVVYRNYRGLLFCAACASCGCAQDPCVRTGANATR